MPTYQTKFFTFDQNNSGGSFDHYPEQGIGCNVYVEAFDATHANARAEKIGLYFDGCHDGRDCDCCGDRWRRAHDLDGAEAPELTSGWGIPSYIHYLDGRIERIDDPNA